MPEMPSSDCTYCLTLAVNSLLAELQKVLVGRVCIVGVGNRQRGDDGAGCLLIDLIANRVGAICLDAGVAPENFLEKVARAEPDTVLIVDAGRFGGCPGEMRVFKETDVGPGGLSTHALSLQMACEYIRARTQAHTYVVAVEPTGSKLGGSICPAVEEAMIRLAEVLLRLCPPGR